MLSIMLIDISLRISFCKIRVRHEVLKLSKTDTFSATSPTSLCYGKMFVFQNIFVVFRNKNVI